MLQERTYTVSQASEFLQVSEETVLNLIHSGRLAASNIGKSSRRPRWRILSTDISSFLIASRPEKFQSAPKRRPSLKPKKDYFAD